MSERVQKLLAQAGVASRRKAEDLIREGRVTVDGKQAQIGQAVDPETARIEVDNKPIRVESPRYLAFNKPAGVVTTSLATHGETTVLDVVQTADRMYPVGRLDKDTTGLLFLTNDGDWANRVTHPRYGVDKEYKVLVQGPVNAASLQRFRSGVVIDGKKAVPLSVAPLSSEGSNTWLQIVLIEGRKREIRLLAAAAGHPVLYLERVRIGDIRLGHLPPGRFRDLSKAEVESFRGAGGQSQARRAGEKSAAENRHRRPGGGRKVDSRQRPRRNS
jgi:23S rRNA pseudouridine2605 synthase